MGLFKRFEDIFSSNEKPPIHEAETESIEKPPNILSQEVLRGAREGIEKKAIENSTILGESTTEQLNETSESIETEQTTIEIAVSHKRIGTGSGEDVAFARPDENLIGVVDGMGGPGNGKWAAQIIAEKLVAYPNHVPRAVREAQEQLQEELYNKEQSDLQQPGAVFQTARLIEKEDGKKYVEVQGVGDARCIVMRNGKIIGQSITDGHVDRLVREGKSTEDEALYHPQRYVVVGPVTASKEEKHKRVVLQKKQEIAVETGDMVLVYSDGIEDNFTPEEFATIVYTAQQEQLDVISVINDKINQRRDLLEAMEKEDDEDKFKEQRKINGVFADGYRSEPKDDDLSYACMVIK